MVVTSWVFFLSFFSPDQLIVSICKVFFKIYFFILNYYFFNVFYQILIIYIYIQVKNRLNAMDGTSIKTPHSF
jgi:hypothetical protein